MLNVAPRQRSAAWIRGSILLLVAVIGLLAAGVGWWFYRSTVLGEQLRAALEEGDYGAVQRLIRQGAPVNTLWDRGDYGGGDTALWVAWERHDLPFVKELLYRGADPDCPSVERITVLMQATGEPEVMRLLVERGADVNARAWSGWTPLKAAIQDGHPEAVKYLISRGADPHLPDANGETALDLARRLKRTELIPLLQ